MMSCRLYLGVILAITLAIIAYFAWRRWRRRRADHFTYATPATPRVNEAVGELFADLRSMVSLGRSFGEQAALMPGPPSHSSGAERHMKGLIEAGPGIARMTGALDRAEQVLGGAPPTYANYLGVYRGLASTDRTLLGAAKAYIEIGHDLRQRPSPSEPGDLTDPAALLGGTLVSMGTQLRRVVASVHRLGAALDVE